MIENRKGLESRGVLGKGLGMGGKSSGLCGGESALKFDGGCLGMGGESAWKVLGYGI